MVYPTSRTDVICYYSVPLRKIAKPEDVACAIAFLASHRAAGHISGECLSVDGGMEGRLIWKEPAVSGIAKNNESTLDVSSLSLASQPKSGPSVAMQSRAKRKVQVALSVDFDAISGLLGTGKNDANNKADYSQGFFAGTVGVHRLIKLFKKHDVAAKVTWFLPGHSIETFFEATKAVKDSGCEIALHGYSHEVRWTFLPMKLSYRFLGRVSDDRAARERRPREVY